MSTQAQRCKTLIFVSKDNQGKSRTINWCYHRSFTTIENKCYKRNNSEDVWLNVEFHSKVVKYWCLGSTTSHVTMNTKSDHQTVPARQWGFPIFLWNSLFLAWLRYSGAYLYYKNVPHFHIWKQKWIAGVSMVLRCCCCCIVRGAAAKEKFRANWEKNKDVNQTWPFHIPNSHWFCCKQSPETETVLKRWIYFQPLQKDKSLYQNFDLGLITFFKSWRTSD